MSFQPLRSSALVFGLVWAGVWAGGQVPAGDPSSPNQGSPSPCSPIPGIRVGPKIATVDHQAVPPRNSQKFSAFALASPGCVAPMSTLPHVTWSVSDATNVRISNAKDNTNGMATCVGPTSGATVTATLPATEKDGQPLTATATLTCQ